MPHFECGAFNHSATSPHAMVILITESQRRSRAERRFGRIKLAYWGLFIDNFYVTLYPTCSHAVYAAFVENRERKAF